MKLIIFTGLLDLIFVLVPAQDFTNLKPSCFYNKDQEVMLKIEKGNKFLLVDKEILFGTKFLLVEKGYIQLTKKNELEFMVTSLANLESNKVDVTKKEDLSGEPFLLHGELDKKGIKIISKGVYVKQCPCKRKEFEILDELKEL